MINTTFVQIKNLSASGHNVIVATGPDTAAILQPGDSVELAVNAGYTVTVDEGGVFGGPSLPDNS